MDDNTTHEDGFALECDLCGRYFAEPFDCFDACACGGVLRISRKPFPQFATGCSRCRHEERAIHDGHCFRSHRLGDVSCGES